MSEIDRVIEGYTAAWGYVHRAACLIEEAPVLSADGRAARARLGRALDDVYGDMSRVLGSLREARDRR